MTLIRKAIIAIAGLAAVALAACASGPASGSAQDMVALGSDMPSYRLGAGDEIKVTVFGEADLSGSYVVDGQGQITLPLVGQVIIGKLTLSEASTSLENRLRTAGSRTPRSPPNW